MKTSWLERATNVHRYGVIGLMLIVTTGFVVGVVHLSEPQQLVVSLFSVALTGLSHGAVDHLVDGEELKPFLPMPALITAYISLMILVVFCWHIMPTASLVCFLILSVIHFGADMSVERINSVKWMHILCRGAIPILIPCFSHFDEVQSYFRRLGCDIADRLLQSSLGCMFILWLLLVAVIIAEKIRYRQKFGSTALYMENACLAGMCWLLPPLMSFAIYFCVLHSGRQILRLAYHFDPDDAKAGLTKFVLSAAPLTLLSLIGSTVVFSIENFRAQLSTVEINTLFVSLAALTLPHMMLGCAAELLRTRNGDQAIKTISKALT